MTESKHTPGPWEVTGFTDCQLITKDVPPAIGHPIPIGKTYGENQIANAYLFAAAPSMLAALKLHIDYEALPADRGGKNGRKGRAWAAFIAARDAAIAEAEAAA